MKPHKLLSYIKRIPKKVKINPNKSKVKKKKKMVKRNIQKMIKRNNDYEKGRFIFFSRT